MHCIQARPNLILNGMSDFTIMLNAAAHGDDRSAKALLPLVYDDLRRLAHARMAMEPAHHTLQPTALVHEAWLRLVGGGNDQTWKNRVYFLSAASTAMRRILVEHARRKNQVKRGGDQLRVDIDAIELADANTNEKVLLVDEALKELEREDPQRARIVVMKFFGGMTNSEVAEALELCERSVYRHWACAKSWLFDRISPE